MRPAPLPETKKSLFRTTPSAHLRTICVYARSPSHLAEKRLRGPRSSTPSEQHKEPVTMSTLKKLALAALTFSAAFLVPLAAFAQEKGASNVFDVRGWAAVGSGLAIGLAVIGGTLGQGRAAAAALEGISRNPGASARIQTPMILGLALIESLVLIAFVIAFWLRGVAAG